MFNIKKIIPLISLVVAIPLTISTAQAEYIEGMGNYTCNQTFPVKKLRWEKDRLNSYQFFSRIVSHGERIGINSFKVGILEQGDFNDSKGISTTKLLDFNFTDWLKNKSYIVNPWNKGTWLKANNFYKIYNRPVKRNHKNLYLVYQMNFYKQINGKWDMNNLHKNYDCQPYEITWCGDGIVDNYYDKALKKQISETCDPQDPNKLNWGNNGCNLSCKPIS